MTTKRTRARKKHSSLRFDMAVLNVRQLNLAMSVKDALMSMHLEIAKLQEEVDKLKRKEI